MADELRAPSTRDLRQLPFRARVAFAARCARRVLPLFHSTWPDAPKEFATAVNEAVKLAERFAAGHAYSHNDARTAWRAVNAAANPPQDLAAKAPMAARGAAAAAAGAVQVVAANIEPAGLADKAANAGDAVRYAASAVAYAADATAESMAVKAMHEDYLLLLQTSRRDSWTDETPVAFEFLGPLWPNGEPNWHSAHPATEPAGESQPNSEHEPFVELGEALVAEAVSTSDLRVKLWIDPGNASIDDIQELFQTLSDLNRAAGGSGLRFVRDNDKVPVVEGVH